MEINKSVDKLLVDNNYVPRHFTGISRLDKTLHLMNQMTNKFKNLYKKI